MEMVLYSKSDAKLQKDIFLLLLTEKGVALFEVPEIGLKCTSITTIRREEICWLAAITFML